MYIFTLRDRVQGSNPARERKFWRADTVRPWLEKEARRSMDFHQGLRADSACPEGLGNG